MKINITQTCKVKYLLRSIIIMEVKIIGTKPHKLKF